MKKTFYILAIFLAGSAISTAQVCPSTFLKTYGSPGSIERGYGVYDAGDDKHLYFTGLKDDDLAFISMIDTMGMIAWTRTFDFVPGLGDHLSEIIVDSDGMIAGCGISGEGFDAEGFYFRYDPAADQMLWSKTGMGLHFVFTILELGPGGNYLISCNPHDGNKEDAKLVEVDRNTGDINTNFQKRYNAGAHDAFRTVIRQNTTGNLIVGGNLADDNTETTTRAALATFDSDGFQIWNRLSHILPFMPARLYGRDMVLDGTFIVSTHSGDDNDTSSMLTEVFLQRSLLSGSPLSVRKYILPEFEAAMAEEIVATNDGYILYGRNTNGPSNLFVFKVNLDGIPQWANRLDLSPVDDFAADATQQSQIILYKNHVYGAAYTRDAGLGHDAVLFKIDMTGSIGGACPYFVPTPIIAQTISSAVSFSDTLVMTNHMTTIFDGTVTPQSATLNTEQYCKFFLQTAQNIGLCPGDSVVINNVVYTGAAIVKDTLVSTTGSCDTIMTYNITTLPYVQDSETVQFCAGGSVTIDGMVYTQPGTVDVVVPSTTTGCDTLLTYTLEVTPMPTGAETIAFCSGDSVVINGTIYTQPGTVDLIIPSTTPGCDSMVTYTLVFTTPGPANLNLSCPPDIEINLQSSNGQVDFDLPMIDSDCDCPGIDLFQTSGPASGSIFPQGVTPVCFSAQDSCGNMSDCCFNVTVIDTTNNDPCDIKINGCVRFEVLGIFADAAGYKTYRMNLINNCPNELIYIAYYVPNGLEPTWPSNNATYVAPGSNREYIVRNPNFTPFYGIRYKNLTTGIANGQSDIFEYTLPPQAQPAYVNALVRLSPQIYVEVFLDFFGCEIQYLDGAPETDFSTPPADDAFGLFPNPTSQSVIMLDLPEDLVGQSCRLQLFDSQGQSKLLKQETVQAPIHPLELPGGLNNGMYFLQVAAENGKSQVLRFVVQQ
jgi:hypothetical protein